MELHLMALWAWDLEKSQFQVVLPKMDWSETPFLFVLRKMIQEGFSLETKGPLDSKQLPFCLQMDNCM